MGAPRLCPRCGTPVDERRARGLPYCLQCGAPMGSGTHGMTPVAVQSSSGAPGAAKGMSPLVWVLIGGGVVALLAGGAAVVAVILLAKSTPVEPPVLAGGGDAGPNLENKDFGDAAAGGAAGAGAKKPTPKIGGTGGTVATGFPTGTSTTPTRTPFPRARANAEVDRVLQTAQSCHVTGDPTGTGSIRVDFEPDGRVNTLTRAPFGGTATGSCIAARMRAIRIGAFEDPPRVESVEATFIIKGATPAPSSTSRVGGR